MTVWFHGGHQASWLHSFVQGKLRKSLWTRRCPQLVGERVRTDFAFSITRTQCLAFADMTPIPKKVICKGLVKKIYVWSLWQVVSLRLLRTLRFWLSQASSTASTRYQPSYLAQFLYNTDHARSVSRLDWSLIKTNGNFSTIILFCCIWIICF